ncbi:MAG: hypothetical protein IJD48_04280 [Clostridia bacterium]|nr:hypothetical protein [Clostridia bacterium]
MKSEISNDFLKLKKASKPNNTLRPLFQLLVVIVNRGKGDEVSEFLKQNGIKYRICSFGDGTAPSTFQNILGLYNKEKEIVTSIIPIENSIDLLDRLETEFLTIEKYSGIAFTIPLKSITMESMEKLVKGDRKNGK